MTALPFNSFLKPIHIPVDLRGQPIDRMAMSVRLTGVLRRANIRVLGDLHGCKLDDFALQRNCGYKTLHELDALVRQAHSSVEQVRDPEAGSLLLGNGVRFVIPESISQLRFAELPITSRATNLVRSIGLRTLGDLNGRSASELLRCKNCGWRTVEEVGQLIERAISGEFDEAQIEESAQPTELLRLLDEAMAKLSPRDKHLLLARIGGDDVPPSTLEEVGHQHALTRARVQQIMEKTLNTLKKTWGPRVPRLLEAVKRRCLSNVCPLSATDVATHILDQSDEPLTAEEIRSRAIQTFGTKTIQCEARAISNALSSNQGIFLVGPGLYGMGKHLKLPVSEWNRVRTEFAQLLAKESRPISCYEVLNDRLITGLTNARPDELAYILRKDSQFADLGFLIFALAIWASDPEFRREMARRRRLRVGRGEGERNGVHKAVLHRAGVRSRAYRARRRVLTKV